MTEPIVSPGSKEEKESLKSKVLSGFSWSIIQQFGNQAISFIVSIVLARLVAPEVFGTLAIVLVITSFLGVFIDSGFGMALVQKKDAGDLEFSTIFYFNVFMGFFLYAIVFILAPRIADYYCNSSLVWLIRTMGLSLIIGSIKNTQSSYASKYLLFKQFAVCGIISIFLGGFFGIFLAYLEYGIWSLVAYNLLQLSFEVFLLWFLVRWRPKPLFSFIALKELFGFGWKLLASSLIDRAYLSIRPLIIGKLYTTTDLAFYNRGENLPNVATSAFVSAINTVLFPTMSLLQEDLYQIKQITRRSIKTSTVVIFPIMIGMAACSTPLVNLLFTEKWLGCVPFMQVFCISGALLPLERANLNAMKALGRSDLILKLEIAKKVLGIAFLIISVPFGMMAIAFSTVISNILAQILNATPNKKLFHYGILEQVTDIFPSILISIVMGACIFPVSFLPLPNIILLIIQLISGILIYSILSRIFKVEPFIYLWNIALKLIHKGYSRY